MAVTRVGVAGAGHWGPHLIRVFEESPRASVAAVAESDPARRALIAGLHPGIPLEADADRLLSRGDLDAVVIATPSSSHYRLAAAAIERGLHAFVEKPLARSLAEAEDLAGRAARAGVVLFVGHVFLFNEAVRTARSLIQRGELGRILYLSSTRANLGPVRTDVSALWDLAPHDISIVLDWLGTVPIRATAKGGSYLNAGLEDVVFATLEFPDGILASLHVTWLAPHKTRLSTVVGDRKMLVFDDRSSASPLTLYDRGIEPSAEPVSETMAAFRSSIRDGQVTHPSVDPGEPLRSECEHFLDCVQHGNAPRSGAAEGIAVVRVLEAIERSLRNGSRDTEIAG